jgi:adenine-specific DNA-methyltransferase
MIKGHERIGTLLGTIELNDKSLLEIHNRKYIGAKFRLLDFITEVILLKVGKIHVFIDGFAGTGVVANRMRPSAFKVITNDLLYSNYIVNKAFLTSTVENVNLNKVGSIIEELNKCSSEKGYVFQNFGGTYFTFENAGRIDTIRETIQKQYMDKKCTQQEMCVLLTSLLFAIDKVANTVGQYDAYLKHIGRKKDELTDRHIIDSNVNKAIYLKIPKIDFSLNHHNEVYNEDINSLIKKINGDVLYLDPPYNTRQYIDCYHVLENILFWQKPMLYGKTKKFLRTHLKSKYSKKRLVAATFSELIRDADVEHIILSYNSEGILSDDSILGVLGNKGKVEIFEREYNVFGNGAGRASKRILKERLFYCKVNK